MNLTKTLNYNVCRAEKIDTMPAEDFFKELQAQAFNHANELLGEVAGAAQRLWTSEIVMR